MSLELEAWLKAVEQHATKYGFYNFSVEERKRLAQFVRGDLLHWLHVHRFTDRYVEVGTMLAYSLVHEARKGIAKSVAAKLKGLS